MRTVVFDTTPPAAPTGLAATSPTESSPSLTWTPSAGAVAYRVTRDGTDVGTATAGAYADAQIAASGTYVYAVIAVDAAGNVSAPSASRAIEVRFSPNGVIGLGAGSPTTSAALNWVAGTAAAWVVWRDGTEVATPTSPSFSDPGAGEGTHRYAVGVAGSGDLEPPARSTSWSTARRRPPSPASPPPARRTCRRP